MLNILSIIPKQVWFILASVLLGATIIVASYNKGASSERTKWKLKLEEQVNEQVNLKLIEVNRQLEKALEFKATKDEIIKSQSEKLNASETRSKQLQERLNNVLSNATGECSSLPDDEYRLYQDYLQQDYLNQPL